MDSIFCVCSSKAHHHYSMFLFIFSSSSIAMVVWSSGPSDLMTVKDWFLILLYLSFWTLSAQNDYDCFHFLYDTSTKLLEFDYTHVFLLFYHDIYAENYFLFRLNDRWIHLHFFWISFYLSNFCTDQVFYVWFKSYYFCFSSALVRYFDDNL